MRFQLLTTPNISAGSKPAPGGLRGKLRARVPGPSLVPAILLGGLSISLLLYLAGCGPKHPNLPAQYPVTGTIRLDGKPLIGAGIMFLPRGETRGTGAFGMTDDAGKYTLKTDYGGPGAPEGEFAVTISKVVNRDGTPYVFNPDVAEAGERETLPAHYNDSMKTILDAKVPKGGDTIDFDLKSKR
jgi:hypothetical protein